MARDGEVVLLVRLDMEGRLGCLADSLLCRRYVGMGSRMGSLDNRMGTVEVGEHIVRPNRNKEQWDNQDIACCRRRVEG